MTKETALTSARSTQLVEAKIDELLLVYLSAYLLANAMPTVDEGAEILTSARRKFKLGLMEFLEGKN